ncbi:MAG: NADH-quinone oxidoreductase subunit C, partial [Elusimicrobiota bacterium]
VRVTQAILLDVIKFLRDEFKFYHLSTITGLDKGDFEMQYHFANELAVVTVSTMVPRAELKMKGICAIIPGAVLYEREIQDMFGITVENIPDPRPLVMPDDWEEGNYPLRKDWKFERKPEVIPGEKNGD